MIEKRPIINEQINILCKKEQSNKNTDCISKKKNFKIIQEERLLLLDAHRSKLNNNLQCFEKNHVELTSEIENLSQMIDETNKCLKNPKKNISSSCIKEQTKRSVEDTCNHFCKVRL
jgi:hypothetical protein